MSDLLFLKKWIYKHARSSHQEHIYQNILKEFELFFEYVFNYSKDGISVLDLDYNILGVNHTMEHWYSHKHTLIGEKCYAVYHDRDRPCENCPTRESIHSGKPTLGIVPYEDAGEVKGSQELSVFPLFDDNNTMFSIVEYVRDITDHKKKEEVIEHLKKRLQFQKRTLREQETALRVLLREGEKNEKNLASTIHENINMGVAPLITMLKRKLDDHEARELLDAIETRLSEITSPYLKQISLSEKGLTPRETEIAALVKEGKTSKEIADLLGISIKAVDFHRSGIRKKLHIAGEKRNLYTYLNSLNEP
jgi:DNA-binding CsgD family transcriptional regulator